jgi:hypothetical protein
MNVLRFLALGAALLVPSVLYGQTAPYASAPLCASHDNRAWHSLWNASEGCHYDHHHGDDPSLVNDLFGTSLFDRMGGSISHPWQTFSAAGYENDLKHAGYFWHVGRNIPATSGQVQWITDYRLQVHQHPSGRDVPVRHHSFVMEARVINVMTGRVGFIRTGGWVDFGHLVLNGVKVLDVGQSAEPGRHRQHGSTGGQGIWYGATAATHVPDRFGRIARGFVTVSTSVHDLWDATQAHDFGNFLDYECTRQFGIAPTDTRCRNNGTVLRAHLLGINGQAAGNGGMLAVVDPDGNGVIDWTGYTDRYGVPQQAGVCSAASLDCFPTVLSGVETSVNYACDAYCGNRITDHDIYFGNRTAGWSIPRP